MNRRPPTVLLVLAVPVVALIAVLATRAIEGPSDAATASATAGAHTIVIKSFAFHPRVLTVAKGTTLEVANEDDTTHTFSARNGSFTTGDLDGGKRTTIKLNRSGTFTYFCKIHNFMTGTLVVK
jgi:plastocyanin